jgi:diguanylate cyclase (GGDEF)-like protein
VIAKPEGAAGFRTSIWVIVVAIGLLVATALGYALARLLARPLQRLAEGAMAVASGDFDTHVDAEGQGDVAQLAQAFNSMTENLRGYVGELRKSRDELRRGLDRLGTTLSSTHDLEGMFGVILDTAAITLGAKAGAVYLISPSGRDVRLEVARGYEAPERAALRIGEGIAGRSAAGISVLLPSERDPVSPSRPVEPAAPTAIAVPLIRGDRTMGVLALYGRSIPEPFVQDDVATLGSFAAQASVAVENVLLHKEAQRLSITDGLTGVWNRRYLQLTLTKEIERAQRFDRPLSVLMMDIDHFKLVNDAHGHQVGDEVLVELTRRTMSTIRGQIDALARYGGEEFVVVLPETPREGARIVADKILSVIRHRPFGEDGEAAVPLTVSIGVAAFPEDGSTADELVRAADLAMYRAKEAGRNRVETAPSR